MINAEKPKEELLDELAQLRQRVQELEDQRDQSHQQLLQEQIARSQAEQTLQAVVQERDALKVALQENRSLFESFMGHAPLAAYIKDEDGRYLYMKPLLERLRQLPSSDLVGKTDLELFGAEAAQHIRANDRAVLAKGEAIQVLETVEVDGEERYYSSFKFPFYNASGQQCLAGVSLDVTDLKQAETSLRQSQELYQTLTEALPNFIWVITADGKLDYANQQWREALGVTIEQVNQAGWGLILHPDDLPVSLAGWQQIQAGANRTEREYRHRMADGTYRWFLARMLVIRDQQGQLVRIVGASTDIHERKRMEDALRSSEERLALASQAAKVGTFEWNIQTNELVWTAEEEALYGLPPGSFEGRFENWVQTIHPEDRDRATQAVADALAHQADLHTEFRVIHPDGKMCWLLAKGRVFYDAEGRPLRMIGMNEDITDRKQLEMEREELLQQLESSLSQFEAVINSMSEGLLVSDAQGNVLLFNPAAMVLHEYDSVEQGRRHLREFPDTFEGFDLQGNALPLDAWPLGKVLKGETYRDYEIHVHHLNTGTRWIGSFSGTPVYNKQGQMILAIVTMHDISDRKRAEAERLQLLDQERQAREQAESANRIKDEFLAVLSHELRSPLNPILGWARLLQNRKFDDATFRKAIETIERNAQLQVELIEDLLDISRILQGKLSLNPCPIRLSTIIDAAIETVRLAAEVKGIEIRFTSEPDLENSAARSSAAPIQVLGDPARLQQVVWNLLSNAVKFTPEGGQIHVSLERGKGGMGDGGWGIGNREWEMGNREQLNRSQLPTSNSELPTTNSYLPNSHYQPPTPNPHPPIYAQIQVTDTGKGINPEFLPFVFETFRQADSSITRTFGGLGLGLAIARHIVELHGGTIGVESPGEGQGATFTVKLPLLLQDPVSVQETPVADSGLTLDGIQVLSVDDELDNLELVTFILEQAGATVIAVSSAEEALQQFVQAQPDILLTDIGMPEMDGYQLLQRIRTLQEGQPVIPAIAITAYAGEVDQQQAMAVGFQQHISKPLEPEVLLQAILSLVRSS